MTVALFNTVRLPYHSKLNDPQPHLIFHMIFELDQLQIKKFHV